MINEEIEKIWQEDIKEKKLIGSKSSGSRKMRTAYDFMTKKEKQNLNGKVEVSSMYDSLVTKEIFNTYTEEKQTEVLTHWRGIYPNQKIMDALEIKSPGQFNSLIEKLNIPKKSNRKRKGKQKEAPAQNHSSAPAASGHREKMDTTSIDGLVLNYNGIYTPDQLSKIWTKLQLITEGEENSFSVSIIVQEKKE